MKNITALNRKQVRKILSQVEKQFDCDIEELEDKYYFFKTKKDKINIINKELARIDIGNLNILNVGLYFCKPEEDWVRLSIEGSWLIKNPKKNIVVLGDEQYRKYMKGEDVQVIEPDGCKLLKHKEDWLGSSKMIKNTLFNYIPKERRAK